ncbi:hypothetical protein AYI70_g7434 [Smittium culicis]|uniref:Uncharacterized protein n=1 Tax=Smittium culicis TaxID=133412 RepID=A0A1R1XKR3_9FUNG|nr:hypothetical protein AYI70_g7434 [Smittium culicis]
MSVRNDAVPNTIFTDGVSQFLRIMEVDVFNSPPRSLLNKGRMPEFCRLRLDSKVISDNPLGYFAVIISDLPSPQCLGSRFISGSLQEPLLPAYSPADPCIKPILERLADQIADPCFQCDPFFMATFPGYADTR